MKDIIVYGGGKLVQDVDQCDMLICHYREGPEYIQASQSCKEVGNLSWLYHLIVHNEWCSPLHRLLHYPIPKDGIEGFNKFRITVSNYGGEARSYLENLIKACGAEFTRTMKADNTHLITAQNSGEKCKAAPEWGITTVNHLWLEESYAKCMLQPVNTKKYNHFPPRTNLGEIIGQTFLDESKLRELYYPGGEATMSPRAKRKRRILEAAEDNRYPNGPAEGVLAGQDEEDEDDDAKASDEENVPRSVKTAKVVRKAEPLETPVRSRSARLGKENETPSILSTGGRSAKAKAKDMLQQIAPDIALYEKEKKRGSKPGTPWGGKRATNLMEMEETVDLASSPTSNKMDIDESKRSSKKPRMSRPDVEMRFVLTSFPRWVENQNKEDQDRVSLAVGGNQRGLFVIGGTVN